MHHTQSINSLFLGRNSRWGLSIKQAVYFPQVLRYWSPQSTWTCDLLLSLAAWRDLIYFTHLYPIMQNKHDHFLSVPWYKEVGKLWFLLIQMGKSPRLGWVWSPKQLKEEQKVVKNGCLQCLHPSETLLARLPPHVGCQLSSCATSPRNKWMMDIFDTPFTTADVYEARNHQKRVVRLWARSIFQIWFFLYVIIIHTVLDLQHLFLLAVLLFILSLKASFGHNFFAILKVSFNLAISVFHLI